MTEADKSALHVASGRDATEAAKRADQLSQILGRADARDQAAERRDRAAENRSLTESEGAIDRDWSGRDRDLGAGDRADLIELLQRPEPEAPGGQGQPAEPM